MCGIAGFVGLGDRADLAAMTTALAHRGPDGDGLYCDPQKAVYLGHRRLAIVDLAGGAQPMWNADRSIGVIFNGEIYNHLELRTLLESRGYVFCSNHSDTEVLVHGYAECARLCRGSSMVCSFLRFTIVCDDGFSWPAIGSARNRSIITPDSDYSLSLANWVRCGNIIALGIKSVSERFSGTLPTAICRRLTRSMRGALSFREAAS
jgi:glutamine phosphoribosylpyrophosphate amidotransferase